MHQHIGCIGKVTTTINYKLIRCLYSWYAYQFGERKYKSGVMQHHRYISLGWEVRIAYRRMDITIVRNSTWQVEVKEDAAPGAGVVVGSFGSVVVSVWSVVVSVWSVVDLFGSVVDLFGSVVDSFGSVVDSFGSVEVSAGSVVDSAGSVADSAGSSALNRYTSLTSSGAIIVWTGAAVVIHKPHAKTAKAKWIFKDTMVIWILSALTSWLARTD